MNFKKRVLFFLMLIFNINLLIAGCGGCQINNNSDIETSSSIFIESIPANGKIDGFVVASCNKCNLGKISDRKCSMGIKVDNQVYSVYGYNESHEAAHKSDGICNALRIAHVKGKISYKTFYPDTFNLMIKPN